MDLTSFSKAALLKKCEELGIVKCKSKNKKVLIELINKIIEKNNTNIENTKHSEKSVNINNSIIEIVENKDNANLEKNCMQSKNSLIAISGYKAEDIFITSNNIKVSLEKYFKLNITNIIKIHGKKYDTNIIFNNNTTLNIQNKKIINLGGRGDSFDRRHIKNTFNNQFIRKYLTHLSLIRKSNKETFMTENQKTDFIKLCNNNIVDIKQYIKKTLIGTNDNENHYWCIMKTDKNFTKIELYIIPSVTLYNFICDSINIDIKLKNNGTCLHISPYISLQRKGGTNTDNSPNHIQAKIKITKQILDLCDKIL